VPWGKIENAGKQHASKSGSIRRKFELKNELNYKGFLGLDRYVFRRFYDE
jgi:hypothetical protein